jgi:hypothetical protein
LTKINKRFSIIKAFITNAFKIQKKNAGSTEEKDPLSSAGLLFILSKTSRTETVSIFLDGFQKCHIIPDTGNSGTEVILSVFLGSQIVLSLVRTVIMLSWRSSWIAGDRFFQFFTR